MCFAAQASPGLLSLRGTTRWWPTALGPDGSDRQVIWARNPSGLQGWRVCGHSASLWVWLATSVPTRIASRTYSLQRSSGSSQWLTELDLI